MPQSSGLSCHCFLAYHFLSLVNLIFRNILLLFLIIGSVAFLLIIAFSQVKNEYTVQRLHPRINKERGKYIISFTDSGVNGNSLRCWNAPAHAAGLRNANQDHLSLHSSKGVRWETTGRNNHDLLDALYAAATFMYTLFELILTTNPQGSSGL